MKKRKFLATVANHYGSHAGTYEVEAIFENEVNLSRSPTDRGWTRPGEPVGYVKDTGNGIEFSLNGEVYKLEYYEIEELLLLFRTYNHVQDKVNKALFKIYELK